MRFDSRVTLRHKETIRKGTPYDATSRAVVPTNDYANGYAQGWSDARAGLSASYYNR